MTRFGHSAHGDSALGLNDRWYAALPISRLEETPVEVRLAGQTVRIWRTAAGAASDGPPVALGDHYAWLYQGEGDPGTPPALPLRRRQWRRLVQRTVTVEADYRLVLENSLDFAHSAVAHRFSQPNWWLHRLPGLPPLQATYRPTADGLEVVARWGRRVVFEHHFALPDRLHLILLPDSPLATEVVVHHVPEDRRRCRMEILVALPGLGGAARWRPGDLLLHRQDKVIVERQQRALDDDGSMTEFSCSADAYTLLLRRILAAAAEGAWPPERLDDPRDLVLPW